MIGHRHHSGVQGVRKDVLSVQDAGVKTVIEGQPLGR